MRGPTQDESPSIDFVSKQTSPVQSRTQGHTRPLSVSKVIYNVHLIYLPWTLEQSASECDLTSCFATSDVYYSTCYGGHALNCDKLGSDVQCTVYAPEMYTVHCTFVLEV